MKQTLDVVAALIWKIEDGKKKMMICQRPAHKPRGLAWEFVGGKVERGESGEQALIRECREELGITVRPFEKWMEVLHEYPDVFVRLSLYRAEIAEGEPQLLEHADLRWITTSEIPLFEFCPADQEILERICAVCNAEERIQRRLLGMQELAYREFQCKLMPTVEKARVIGVRTPLLRRLARELSKQEEGSLYLQALPHIFYEENNLHAFLIEQIGHFESTVTALDAFLPCVDNWATCDSLSPRIFSKNPQALLPHIRKWIASGETYTVRYGIGCLMKYFLGAHFQLEYAETVAKVKSDKYYVNMMISWYFATALAYRYEETLPFLTERRLSPWIHAKTIQKGIESNQISQERKAELRSLR